MKGVRRLSHESIIDRLKSLWDTNARYYREFAPVYSISLIMRNSQPANRVSATSACNCAKTRCLLTCDFKHSPADAIFGISRMPGPSPESCKHRRDQLWVH